MAPGYRGVDARIVISRFGALYLPLAGVTLFYKLLFLRAAFGREGISRGMALPESSGLSESARAFLFVTSSDALQVALLAAFIVAVTTSSHIWFRRLGLTSIAVVVLLGALNFVAIRQIGTLVTREHLAVAWAWSTAHPRAAIAFVSAPTLGRLAVVVAAAILTIGVSRWLLANAERRRAGIALGGIAIVATGASAAFAATSDGAGADSVLRKSYWSSAGSTFLMTGRANPLGAPVRTLEVLRKMSARMNLPLREGVEDPGNAVERVRGSARYVVIVALETAPAAYYPLAANPAFPAFMRMAQGGISSDRHYSTMPRTTEALFSVATGLYPVDDVARLVMRRRSRADFLSTLSDAGFETTFIDSFSKPEGWFNASGSLWGRIGFSKMKFSTINDPSLNGMRSAEAQSFASALEAIDSARSAKKGSYVLIATAIGHFPWPSRHGGLRTKPAQETFAISSVLDSLTGNLLDGLAARGIIDSSVVIVTGDHGFRFRAEYAAVNEPVDDGNLTFKVPLLLYAPGQIRRGGQLMRVTSHVDLAPTLLSLLGLQADSVLMHGRDLRSVPDGRAVYTFSTGLSPFESVLIGDRRFTRNTLTGEIATASSTGRSAVGPPLSAGSVTALLFAAHRIIDQSIAYQFALPEKTGSQ